MPRNSWLVLMAVAVFLSQVGARGADALKRRPWFGAALAPVPAEAREANKLGENEGVLIQQVLPGSSAEALGLQAGDVVLTFGGAKVGDAGQLIRQLARHGTGDAFDVEWVRGGNRTTKRLTLKERPREQSSDFDVVYDSVESKGARLRTIVTRPKAAGKYPALFLIQGLGCFSVDNPPPGDAYRTIFYDFARNGYVTMRVDKPGCGDSEGGPCQDNDFETVLDGYRQALKALKALPYVDPERVVVFGHSMGGIMGPIIAAEVPVRGLAVYGTVARPWQEYTVENLRRQLQLRGVDRAEIDRTVRRELAFNHHYFTESKPPKEIAALGPEMAAHVRANFQNETHQFGRHHRFFQQLNGYNLPSYWQRVDANVLALWGKGDFVSAGEDHAAIAEIVNAARPGKGVYKALDGIDHGFTRAASQLESIQRRGQGPGEFNPLIISTLREWADGLR